MGNPKISVLMPVYNESKVLIKKAVDSILNQTFYDYEFMIVLDNPTREDLWAILKDYSVVDRRIFLIKNKENLGVAKSLNKALELAKGKYVAIMHADDIALSNRLLVQYEFIEKNNYDLIGGWAYKINEKDEIIGEFKYPCELNILQELIRFSTICIHPTWFGYRRFFLDIGGYRDIPPAEDFDLLNRALLKGYKLSNINEFVLKYRIFRPGRTSLNKPLIQLKLTSIWKKFYERGKEVPLHILKQALKENIAEGFLNKLSNYLYLKGMSFKDKNNKFLASLFILFSIATLPNYGFKRFYSSYNAYKLKQKSHCISNYNKLNKKH